MPRKRKKRAFSSRLLRWFTLFLLLLVVITWVPVLLLGIVKPPVTAFMLQQSGESQGTAAYNYQWKDWPDLGTAPALAVMAAEDQKFPDHRGFDMTAIQNALIGRLDGNRLRGASTITQQVAKNLFLWPGRSFARKAIEAYLTVLIEISWPKRRILEMYLNIAEFGPGIYGVPAASRIYFGKTPARLSDAEAALLAAVLPNPRQLRVDQPSAYVRERQRWIMAQLDQLRRNDWISRVTRSQ